jgi:hypothetical protein
MWKRIVVLSIIAGCGGGGDDAAKTKAFVESYDRAMSKISSICMEVSKQLGTDGALAPGDRAAFIIVYGRAAAAVKLEDAPPSLQACRTSANDAFTKLRTATAEVLSHSSGGNKFETVAIANGAAPAVKEALRELRTVADSCKRDAEQLKPAPLLMSSPYFIVTPSCL